MSKDKIIITCAVTGSLHTPPMSPHLPITPAEIAQAGIDAAEAGAAILHLHAREPDTGKPSQDPDLYMQFLPVIKQGCDAILNLTTGGGVGMSVDERIAPARRAKPEMTSLNMGSMNFVASAMAAKYKDWKFDWEKPYIESTWSTLQPNTYEMIEGIMIELGRGLGERFEYECYEIGHLYNLKYFADKGLIAPPFSIQGIFGVQGALGPEYENLFVFKQTADRLFGSDYRLSCFGIGPKQTGFLTMAALMGGNIRIGLEDSLYLERGKPATSNAQQVARIRKIVGMLGMSVATPAEAREMLATKGGDKVGF